MIDASKMPSLHCIDSLFIFPPHYSQYSPILTWTKKGVGVEKYAVSEKTYSKHTTLPSIEIYSVFALAASVYTCILAVGYT